MAEQKEEQKNQHPLEQLLEAVVINCQHIAAICKGLCVKGVSYDVSVKELEKHKQLSDSDSARVLKSESLRCESVLSDCVVQLDKLKRQYLADYNKNEDSESKQQSEQQVVSESSESKQQLEQQVVSESNGSCEPQSGETKQSNEEATSSPEPKAAPGRKPKKTS
tara:strand:+ start:8642 stop:9136 length:495 start_codon:yes stop_codon:yes gene_type:complete